MADINPTTKETLDVEEKNGTPLGDGNGDGNVLVDKDVMNEAFKGEEQEHTMTVWEAAKSHPWACFWAFFMCFTIIMEAFDMFLNTNFVALTAFQQTYGVDTETGRQIATEWQSALFQAGQCGAFIGVFLAGPITTRIGYRWCTILALVLMNATIFISFFANSLTVLTIGQAFEGVPWGLFIANSPAYASEVVPIPLRGAVTGTLQMSWSIGQIIVSAATYGTNTRTDEWAWRLPLALQWIFPTPLLILLWFAPESPWWLVRRGRIEEAATSVRRLARTGASAEDNQATLAMIERTVEIEKQIEGRDATLLDLLKGTDLRRTIITCMMYTSQNFAGNLIANQATYFFEQAGMSPNFSFQLGLINTCLQFVANICFWFLVPFFGRRHIFLGGTGLNVILLLLLGICATVPQNTHTNYAQACLGVVISFVYAGAQGPITYTIIAETSSVRLRALSTAVGRAAYYVTEIPMIYLNSRLLNTTGWNVAGKCGYVWCGTALFFWLWGFFYLPELKHRSYREVDILFNRKVPARKFKSTHIDLHENE